MTKNKLVEMLRSFPLFADVDNLEVYINQTPPKTTELKAGERLNIKNSLALFVDGKADIVKEGDSKSVYLKTLDSPTLLGLATLFDSEGRYISTLVAKTDCVLLVFSEDFVKSIILQNSEFSLALVKLLCQKVRYLNKRIHFYTCSDAEEKLHEFLLSSADSEGKVVMSMSKLSDILSIARASLYRAICSLEEKGLIYKEGKKIIIIK